MVLNVGFWPGGTREMITCDRQCRKVSRLLCLGGKR